MSRIEDYEPESNADFLRSCAFGGNIRRAVAGKKGQKFLRELEAALLGLPEKRLVLGAMAEAEGDREEETYPLPDPVATGEVCALGAVVIARAVAKGVPRNEATQKLAERYDPSELGWSQQQEVAKELKICHPLAYEVIYQNDEAGRCTPEQRYEKVLAWVRRKLKGEPDW